MKPGTLRGMIVEYPLFGDKLRYNTFINSNNWLMLAVIHLILHDTPSGEFVDAGERPWASTRGNVSEEHADTRPVATPPAPRTIPRNLRRRTFLGGGSGL